MSRRWSPDEVRGLVRDWSDAALPTLAWKLQRSKQAVLSKACRLGLPFGLPQGCVLVATLERTSGYHRDVLLRLFRERGVPLRTFARRSIPRGPRKRLRGFYVEASAAADAIAAHDAWMRRGETVSQAARRTGKHRWVIARALRRAGLHRPHAHTLYAPETVDRVLRQWVGKRGHRQSWTGARKA